MKLRGFCSVGTALLAMAIVCTCSVAKDASDDAVQLIIDLLADKDKDLRALALEQIRSESKGENATRQFAAQLPKLPPEAQVGLLSALADRGDRAARPAVLEVLKTAEAQPVRVAAIAATGALGQRDDLPLLVKSLADGTKDEKAAARKSLVRLNGDNISTAIADDLNRAAVPIRVELIEILSARRALETIPVLLSAAVSDEPAARTAAMAALGQLAGPEHTPAMVQGVLATEKGRERDAAEKAIMLVCSRTADIEHRADPLIAAMNNLNDADRLALLPTLGRVGGAKAIAIIEGAITSDEAERHAQGFRALCNWPDASIAPRLIELAKSDSHPDHRDMALAALIRVAPLPDKRPPQEKLALLERAMSMCTHDDDRKLVLKRASAIRIVETLRFILPYLDQPKFAQQACETVVELAHHRELREPNKAEFHPALDKVIATSKDATVIERAHRYKRDQTWARPTAVRD